MPEREICVVRRAIVLREIRREEISRATRTRGGAGKERSERDRKRRRKLAEKGKMFFRVSEHECLSDKIYSLSERIGMDRTKKGGDKC